MSKLKLTEKQIKELKQLTENDEGSVISMGKEFKKEIDKISENLSTEFGQNSVELATDTNMEIQEDGTVNYSLVFYFDEPVSDLNQLFEIIRLDFKALNLNKNFSVDDVNSDNSKVIVDFES